MKENIIREKSMEFAIHIVNLYRELVKNKEYVLSKQVLRAGTSIGANIAESQRSISRKEFLAKMYIAFKECAETKYWLELLYKTALIGHKEFTTIMDECNEIYRILAAITKTMRENNNS